MNAVVKRARALIGSRFRPQGRDPALGLDCVGLACAAYRVPPQQVPGNYRLRGDHECELRLSLERFFRVVSEAQARPGDLAILQTAISQLHLAVLTDSGFVHAHAGLRMVVETPGDPPWPIVSIHRWRRNFQG